MNYIRKMCILRQLKQGFSEDGKALSGLIKAEQYGQNLSIEVSVINFAPLKKGEYYCLIADSFDKCELLALRGKNVFNIVSTLNIEDGFCGIILFVQNEVVPLAYGVNGNRVYDFNKLVKSVAETGNKEIAFSSDLSEKTYFKPYDDETVATENYYSGENDEQIELYQNSQNERTSDEPENGQTQYGEGAPTHDYSENLRNKTENGSDEYYRSVKTEIDRLFDAYPKDTSLSELYPSSQWVRVDKNGSHYLIGVLYKDAKAEYILYAFPCKKGDAPPEEIKDVSVFVPKNPASDDGYFVIFQSSKTGECVKSA